MVEKDKMFKVDDKVFGKVKGYPAWPARITSLNGKRYGVIFYGTNETATLKQDDIFYYLSSKHKFPMQKRRFYAEAIVDIELDIAKCGGSDGNENPQVAEEQRHQPKTTKRKRQSLAANKKQQNNEAVLQQAKRHKGEDQNHNLKDITSETRNEIQKGGLSRNDIQKGEMLNESQKGETQIDLKKGEIEKGVTKNDIHTCESKIDINKGETQIDIQKDWVAQKVDVSPHSTIQTVSRGKNMVQKDGDSENKTQKVNESENQIQNPNENYTQNSNVNQIRNSNEIQNFSEIQNSSENQIRKPSVCEIYIQNTDDEMRKSIEHENQIQKVSENDVENIHNQINSITLDPPMKKQKTEAILDKNKTEENLLPSAISETPQNVEFSKETDATKRNPPELQDKNGENVTNFEEADSTSDIKQNDESTIKDNQFKGEFQVDDINLLPDFYCNAIIIYAERVQNNRDYYAVCKPDPISLDEPSDSVLKVLPVKIDDDKYCGLVYSPKSLDNYSCEYDRALDDAKLVRELLDLQTEILKGNLNITDPRFIKHLDCDDAFVEDKTNQIILTYKKAKFNWLQNEMDAFNALVETKKCLGLYEVKIKEALIFMKYLVTTHIEPISLKKHKFFVDTVVRLRRYVGNIPNWQLSQAEMDEFELGASLIRETADELFVKITGLFGYQERRDEFLEYFQQQCEEFEAASKDMEEAEVFALCAEPLSRRTQLELILEEEALGSTKPDEEL